MNVELAPLGGREDTIFGVGMNCLSGAAVPNTCVGGWKKLDPSNTYADTRQIQVVKDSYSYANLMSISASASASGLTWSASAAISFVRDQTGSDTTVSYVAMRVSKTQTIYADVSKAKISDDAINYLKAQGPSAFAAKYGTHCCIGVAYGGSFVGQLKFEASNSSDKQDITTSMKGSIDAFGGSASIDASFESQRSSISSSYTLTAHSQIIGAEQVDFSSDDPDGMVSACGNMRYTRDTARGVDGNAISFVCQTWDQFPQIGDALNSINKAGARSIDMTQANFAALSAEYAALSYIIGTINILLQSQKFALPGYNGVLTNMANAAHNMQATIQSLSLDTIKGLSVDAINSQYVLSRQMTPLLNAISNNNIMVEVYYYLDGAFVQGGSVTSYVTTTFQPGETQVGNNFVHSRPQGDDPPQLATLHFLVGQDDQGSYLTTHFYWQDPYGPGSGDWYS